MDEPTTPTIADRAEAAIARAMAEAGILLAAWHFVGVALDDDGERYLIVAESEDLADYERTGILHEALVWQDAEDEEDA